MTTIRPVALPADHAPILHLDHAFVTERIYRVAPPIRNEHPRPPRDRLLPPPRLRADHTRCGYRDRLTENDALLHRKRLAFVHRHQPHTH